MTALAERISVDVQIFPNPAEKAVTVNWTEINPDQLQVYNTAGQLVREQAIASGNASTTVSVADLPAGPYSVLLSRQNEIQARKRLVKVD